MPHKIDSLIMYSSYFIIFKGNVSLSALML